jgi:hypothetical protein
MADRQLDVLQGLLGRTTLLPSEVVHLIVEVRNLIDGLNDRSRYPVLRFFCDWIVHRKLDRNTAGGEVLIEFAKVAESTMQSSGVLPASFKRLSPILSLTRLRKEMTLILAEHQLDDGLCCDLERWGPFLATYVDLISRSPLRTPPSRREQAVIDNIRVTKGRAPNAPPPRSSNTTVWQPLPDGPVITIPVGSTSVPVTSVSGFVIGEKIAIGYGATYPTVAKALERYEVANL